MPTDDAREALGRIRRRLDALGARRDFAGGEARSQELAEIEERLLELGEEGAPLDQARERDIFRQVSQVSRWRRLCHQSGLTEERARADRLLNQLLERVLARWRSATGSKGSGKADDWFQDLLRSSRLQIATIEHHPDPADLTERFEEIKTRLREGLTSALADNRVSDATLAAWSKALADQADSALAEVDEVESGRAAEQLAILRDDLAWYLEHIEGDRARRKRLKRKWRRLRAESQERELQARLEKRFGERFVSLTERSILGMISVVLILMVLQWSYAWSPATLVAFQIVDTVACGFFLTEFGLKLAHAPDRLRWVRRHFLIDFIPSIPVGLLTLGVGHTSTGDAVRAGRAARFLRLPRLARYVRLLRPLLRLMRGFGLLARGLDRLAPRFAGLLNRNIILYPTREEMNKLRTAEHADRMGAARLRAELRHAWWQAFHEADLSERSGIVARRLAILEHEAEDADLAVSGWQDHFVTHGREVPARPLLQRLGRTEASDVEEVFDEETLQQVARFIRTFSYAPLRWLPIIASFIPRLSEESSDAEQIAQTARKAAKTLKRYHDLWFWFADLYGTVTPSQFVDRVGTMLVNSSFRPAYRLALFGGALLLVQLGLTWTAMTFLEPLQDFLRDYVGPMILVLGSVSIVVLALGWWMKRLAQEATEFYERSAEAQYLALTEMIRTRYLERDAAILHDRILEDEGARDAPPSREARWERIHGLQRRIQHLLSASGSGAGRASADEAMERLVLACRDWLDGAMFTESDTRTTSQLLGSLAINQLLYASEMIDRKERKRLNQLDLRRQETLFGGPYLWFNFISRACTHAVAMELVEYNRNAIPLRALGRYTEEQRRRYEQWLNRQRGEEPETKDGGEGKRTEYVTTAFTVLHFLDADAERDAQVKERFGENVLRRMQTDRRLLIRRIFGTYPLDNRPKEQRVVNLYAFYQRWLAGGRALFLPFFLLGAMVRALRWLFSWVTQSVREIRNPALRSDRIDAAQGDFRTAVRKINRVRLPIVVASLRLRMKVDPQYLGIPIPGEKARHDVVAEVDADQEFLGADVEVEREIHAHKARARTEMQRLSQLIDGGLMRRAARHVGLAEDALEGREQRRAAALAYLADYRGVRKKLSSAPILDEVFRTARQEPIRFPPMLPSPLLKRRFHRYWRKYGSGGRRDRKAAWRAVQHNVRGAADALKVWDAKGEQAVEEGERLLGRLLQHTEQLSEQLMKLRTVQTLAVLDVLHYREHVFQLGEYHDEEEPALDLLKWRAAGEMETHSD